MKVGAESQEKYPTSSRIFRGKMKKKAAKKGLTPRLVVMKVGRVEKPITEVTKSEFADLMTAQEAAAHFGITVHSVYELIARGRLTKVEMLGRTLLRRSEVEGFQRMTAGRKPKAAKKGE